MQSRQVRQFNGNATKKRALDSLIKRPAFHASPGLAEAAAGRPRLRIGTRSESEQLRNVQIHSRRFRGSTCVAA